MMKITNYLLIIFFILIIQPLHAQQWTDISSTTDINNLSLCHAISADTCIITGQYGQIHKTTDGGLTYETVETQFGLGEWFSDIDFPTNDVGYVCGGTAFGFHRNFITKTIDGGITWDSLIANEYSGYSFNQVAFWNENEGFIRGENNVFLKTIDGGETFTEIALPIEDNYSISSMHFNADGSGYVGVTVSFNTATIKQHKIYKTENAGLNWEPVYSNVINNFEIETAKFINDIKFYDNNIGYACGSNGFFLKTTDGGLNWTEQTLTNDTTILFSIELVDSETLYISSLPTYGSGYRKTFKSTNGGNTWSRLDHSFGRISIAGKGYATTADGKLFKTDYLIPNEDLIQDYNIKVYPSLIHDIVNIEIPDEIQKGNINIINEAGIIIHRYNLMNNPKQQFDLSMLNSGFYFIEILNERGVVLNTSKIIKE